MNIKVDQNDEFNLLEFGRYLIDVSKKAFQFYTRALFSAIWVFICLILVSVGLAYSLKVIAPKYYKTNAVITINNMPVELGEQLSLSFRKFKKDPVLQERLKLSSNAYSSITDFSISFIPTGARDNSFFVYNIDLSLKDTSYLKEIQEKIVSFFADNEYITNTRRKRNEQLTEQKNLLETKIRKIDSTKQVIDNLAKANKLTPDFFYNNPISPSQLNEIEYNSKNELIKVNASLKDKDVEIVQPFISPEKYDVVSANNTSKKIVLGGILLAFILTPVVGRKKLTEAKM